MQEIEIEGKDVQQAVEKGLKQMGLRRDQVEVAIKDEGSSGFLGLGARPARVIIRERKWVGEGGEERKSPAPQDRPASRPPQEERRREPRREERPRGGGPRGERRQGGGQRPEGRPERRQPPRREERPAEAAASQRTAPRPDRDVVPPDVDAAVAEARTVLSELLKLMNLEFTEIKGRWDADQIRVHVDVETADHPLLVGKDGRSLEALQFLSTVLVSRRMKLPVAVQVDAGGWWKSREEKILGQVRDAAEEVARTGQAFRLDPMDPATRRLVHKALAGHPAVETASEGEGPWRKVVLKPKKK